MADYNSSYTGAQVDNGVAKANADAYLYLDVAGPTAPTAGMARLFRTGTTVQIQIYTGAAWTTRFTVNEAAGAHVSAGLEITGAAANPGDTPANTLWRNSTDGGLYFGAVRIDVGGLAYSAVSADVSPAVVGAWYDVDTSGGDVTITLPAAASWSVGVPILIKKVSTDANTLTIQANGVETIDGLNTRSLTGQWQFLRLASNGTNIGVIGG